MSIRPTSTVLLLLAAFHMQAGAQTSKSMRLEQNLQVCANCHGAPAFESPTIDNYLVPRLGGQQAAYIVKALKAYKSRQRDHFFMRGIAAGLSEEEMQDLAEYFSKPSSLEASDE